MAISELKILKYECEECLHDWMMINSGKDSRNLEDNGYFCLYCGTKHLPTYEREELPRFATDEEAGFVDTTKPTAPKITLRHTWPADQISP